jgi:hypothetical protein
MCVGGGPRALTRTTCAREFLSEHAPSLSERVPSLGEALVDSDGAFRWLARYERRCRRMAEQSQTASRRRARVMFLRYALLDRPRRAIARRYPAARLLRQIVEANRPPL